MKKQQREPELVRLWLLRPPEQRTENDVYVFCGWVQQNYPDLLGPQRLGDPCQQLKLTLRRHILHKP